MMFWRLLNVELWMREFIDTDEAPAPQPAAHGEPAAVSEDPAQTGEPAEVEEGPKSDYAPNPGKQLDPRSEADAQTWRPPQPCRCAPLQAGPLARDDDLEALVRERVERLAADLPAESIPTSAPWYFVISEKIVAISQGRSWFTWEVAPRRSAKLLSRFVTRTPAGIGLGDPRSE